MIPALQGSPLKHLLQCFSCTFRVLILGYEDIVHNDDEQQSSKGHYLKTQWNNGGIRNFKFIAAQIWLSGTFLFPRTTNRTVIDYCANKRQQKTWGVWLLTEELHWMDLKWASQSYCFCKEERSSVLTWDGLLVSGQTSSTSPVLLDW